MAPVSGSKTDRARSLLLAVALSTPGCGLTSAGTADSAGAGGAASSAISSGSTGPGAGGTSTTSTTSTEAATTTGTGAAGPGGGGGAASTSVGTGGSGGAGGAVGSGGAGGAASGTGGSGGADPCDGPGEFPSMNGTHCYYYVDGPDLDWNAAEIDCVAWGGHLARIKTENERAFINAAPTVQSTDFWIGGIDKDGDGTFDWLNNEGAVVTGSPPWKSGEPNNPATESCIKHKSGEFESAMCSGSKEYLCEQ